MGRVENLFERLQKWSDDRRFVEPMVDINTFQDSLAAEISWRPMTRGGANFKTHILHEKVPGILSFQPDKRYWFVVCLILGIGLAMFLLGIQKIFFESLIDTGIESAAVLLCGTVFSWAGWHLYKQGKESMVFDKHRSLFWNAKRKTSRHFTMLPESKPCSFAQIPAVQLIQEYNPDHNGESHYSYEINLIMKNSSRVHVMEHGNLRQIKNDAYRLADFLRIPIWDVI